MLEIRIKKKSCRLFFFVYSLFCLCSTKYAIGKIPMVLKTAMHTNHAKWLFLADFHMAMTFITASNKAKTTITGIIHASRKKIVYISLYLKYRNNPSDAEKSHRYEKRCSYIRAKQTYASNPDLRETLPNARLGLLCFQT